MCVKYGVPTTARKVLITTSNISNAQERPSYFWDFEGKLHMLVLLEEPIMKEWALAALPVIYISTSGLAIGNCVIDCLCIKQIYNDRYRGI